MQLLPIVKTIAVVRLHLKGAIERTQRFEITAKSLQRLAAGVPIARVTWFQLESAMVGYDRKDEQGRARK